MDVREVYQIAGVGSRDPLALYRKYVEVDQQAFKAGQWDYDDPSFLCGKIVAALLEVDPLTVTAEEQNWFGVLFGKCSTPLWHITQEC